MPLRASNCKTRGLSALLALSILLGSFCVVTGLCIVPGPDRPQVAVDACHSLQTFNLVSTVTIARSDWSLATPAPAVREGIAERPRIKISNLNFPPDPPPPKAAI